MNVVELEQKKALLVEFAKGRPVGSTFDQIQSNTSETVQILKSMKGGLTQIPIVEVSPLTRSVESAVPTQPVFNPQIAVPAPVVIEKISSAAIPKSKELKTQKTKRPGRTQKASVSTQRATSVKTDKPVVKLEAEKPSKPQKAGDEGRQKAGQPEQKAKPVAKESLTEERKSKGLFKGIGESIEKGFEGGDGRREGRGATEKEDVKETGMLALLGPIAPALQELKGLAGERDEDKPSRISQMANVFKRKKPDEEIPEEKAAKDVRDEKGRFMPGALSPQKAKEAPEVIEKLDIIHADLVSGDKDQEKSNKKQIRAIRGIETGGGRFGGIGGKLKSLVPLLGKFAIALGSVMAVLNAITGWQDKKLQKEAFGLKEEGEATKRQKSAAASASIIDIGGIVTGAAGYFKGEDVTRADLTEGIYKFSSKVNAFFGDYDRELKGKQLEKYGTDIQKGAPHKGTYSASDYGYSGVAPVAVPAKKTLPKNMMGGYSAYDYGYSAISGLNIKGKKSRQMPVSENKTPKLVRKEKELQKKTDVSNRELITESKKTNELLKKLVEKENATPMANNQISDGITNQSDRFAIMGVD